MHEDSFENLLNKFKNNNDQEDKLVISKIMDDLMLQEFKILLFEILRLKDQEKVKKIVDLY